MLSRTRASLWVIVISYYAMFYAANAVLLHLGYRTGEKIAHKVTSDALIVTCQCATFPFSTWPRVSINSNQWMLRTVEEALANLREATELYLEEFPKNSLS